MALLRLFLTFFLLTGVSAATATAETSRNLGWSELSSSRGATVDFPGGLFTKEVADEKRGRLFFSTADGTGRFELFSIENTRGENPMQFARRTVNGERLSYKRVTGNFIAASTSKDGRILYRRCNFSRGMIHCVDIRYPASEERAWDDIVTRISLSLRPR
jgi:hypothetical protein